MPRARIHRINPCGQFLQPLPVGKFHSGKIDFSTAFDVAPGKIVCDLGAGQPGATVRHVRVDSGNLRVAFLGVSRPKEAFKGILRDAF